MVNIQTNEKRIKKSLNLRLTEYNDIRFKSLIVLGMIFITALLMLFTPAITYSEPRASINVSFKGYRLFFYMMTGKWSIPITAGKLNFNLYLPQLCVISYFILFGLLIVIFAIILVNCFIRYKTMYKSGYLMAGWGAVALLWYGVLANTNSIGAFNRNLEIHPLYQVFDIGLTILVCALLMILASGIQLTLLKERIKRVKKYSFIYLLLVVPTICMILFSFYPIFMQTLMAFKDYKIANGIWGSKLVGFQHFKMIFRSREIMTVIGNSIYLSIIRIIATTFPPIVLAIFLFEIGNIFYRRTLQSIVYIPHFFSWVIIYSIFYVLLGNSGIVNQMIMSMKGEGAYVDFLTDPKTIIPTLIISQIWKEVGWSTILYLAALSNIDPTLYEAASIDGAGAMKKLFRITLPGIMSVVVFLFILSIGGILNNNLEQLLLFANLAVRDKVTTIELWVYNQGIGKLEYGISSAMGFFQSLIGLGLVLITNKISKKTVGRGIW